MAMIDNDEKMCRGCKTDVSPVERDIFDMAKKLAESQGKTSYKKVTVMKVKKKFLRDEYSMVPIGEKLKPNGFIYSDDSGLEIKLTCDYENRDFTPQWVDINYRSKGVFSAHVDLNELGTRPALYVGECEPGDWIKLLENAYASLKGIKH